MITGAVAQYGRGMMQDISQKLTKEFAQCLEANISADNPEEGPSRRRNGPFSSEAAAMTVPRVFGKGWTCQLGGKAVDGHGFSSE